MTARSVLVKSRLPKDGQKAASRPVESRSCQRRRGYTIVELLMALAIFGVGVTGVIALQKVTGASNQHARNLAIANHVGQSWLERLAADATSWTHLSNGALQLGPRWLGEVDNSPGTWFLPSTQDGFGARFGALGQPLDADESDQTVFCAHLRLTMLNSPQGATATGLPVARNNGLLRAEVRVLWPRNARAAADYCSDGTVQTTGQDVQSFHFVYQATAIRQSSF
jgi:prepilin-type N-terminal cleavage/methylation domain-containing protein